MAPALGQRLLAVSVLRGVARLAELTLWPPPVLQSQAVSLATGRNWTLQFVRKFTKEFHSGRLQIRFHHKGLWVYIYLRRGVELPKHTVGIRGEEEDSASSGGKKKKSRQRIRNSLWREFGLCFGEVDRFQKFSVRKIYICTTNNFCTLPKADFVKK